MGKENPYDDFIMDHIKNARNFRVLDDADRQAHGSNPLCGDEIDVYLRMDRDRIEDAAFQCTCCGVSMASASTVKFSSRSFSLSGGSFGNSVIENGAAGTDARCRPGATTGHSGIATKKSRLYDSGRRQRSVY